MMAPNDVRSLAKRAFIWWVVLSAACLVQAVATFLLFGKAGLRSILQEGPISNLQHTLLAVALTWSLVGGTLALAALKRLSWNEVFRLVTFLVLAFGYINVMRERTRYGDVLVYFRAAEALQAGLELPARYLYPPLWATLLSPFAPLGFGYVSALIWFLNLLSLLALFVLLPRTLERYGFAAPLATLVGFVFCVANVPILRTLGYMQVNIHITNLILACLLLYPRWKLASAFMLAVAVSIKISPIVLVLPFFFVRDIRWLASFGGSMIVLNLIPVLAYGWSPYTDFLNNLRSIQDANPLAYRDNSFDSLVNAFAHVTGIARPGFALLATVIKAVFAATCLWLALRLARARSLTSDDPGPAAVLSAMPALLVMMVLVSPLFWEHHAVMMGLAYLVLLRVVSGPGHWILFGVAYYLQFLAPTFDFFPWSYGRMVSAGIWLWLAWVLGRNGASDLFKRTDYWMTEVLPSAFGKPLGSTPPARPASGPPVRP